MSCKCVEIGEIEDAINNLESAKGELTYYGIAVNLYKMDTDMACMAVGRSIHHTYGTGVQAGLRRKQSLFGPIRTSLGGKIDAKITELSGELSALKEEDERHHAEEAKKAASRKEYQEGRNA